LSPGQYKVILKKDGYETCSGTLILASGKTENINCASQRTSITNSLGMKFNYIYPGTFNMGTAGGGTHADDDETPHKVKLTRGFYMQTTEVTLGQWKQLMNDNPSAFSSCGNDCPVERVSWYDVQKFIKKLNRKEGKEYRLPTEAEWEYSCRAGNNTAFSFGNTLSKNQANFGDMYNRTLSVKSFGSNDWGLYDMHGNVNEWCQDWYGNYPSYSVTDPQGSSSSSNRKITRGGSHNDREEHCRSANRSRVKPTIGEANNIGFRLVLISD